MHPFLFGRTKEHAPVSLRRLEQEVRAAANSRSGDQLKQLMMAGSDDSPSLSPSPPAALSPSPSSSQSPSSAVRLEGPLSRPSPPLAGSSLRTIPAASPACSPRVVSSFFSSSSSPNASLP